MPTKNRICYLIPKVSVDFSDTLFLLDTIAQRVFVPSKATVDFSFLGEVVPVDEFPPRFSVVVNVFRKEKIGVHNEYSQFTRICLDYHGTTVYDS